MIEQDERLVSPCISVCKINPQSGFCLGCWRTRDEIAKWRDCSISEQRAILAGMHVRRKAAKAAATANQGTD